MLRPVLSVADIQHVELRLRDRNAFRIVQVAFPLLEISLVCFCDVQQDPQDDVPRPFALAFQQDDQTVAFGKSKVVIDLVRQDVFQRDGRQVVLCRFEVFRVKALIINLFSLKMFFCCYTHAAHLRDICFLCTYE